MSRLVLHDYWRSGAAYRVRIALHLKGIPFDQVSHDLKTGAQHLASYAELNPQCLVPTLIAGRIRLTQSLAIIEWLDEVYPAVPLLPADSMHRATVRAMAALIACDVHPLNNLRVQTALRTDLRASDGEVLVWVSRWIAEGFRALEVMISRNGGRFAFGDCPTIADCCLVPQLYAARRFNVSLEPFPRIVRAAEHCEALEAFQRSHPNNQADVD